MLQSPSGEITAIEIKRTLSPKITRGYTESFNTLRADRGYFVIPRGEHFPLTEKTMAMSLPDCLKQLNQ